MERKREKNESGMITVEAVLSLVPFILVILGIISFINIYMVHNKVQYALFQIGSELTAYTYFYEITGLREVDKVFTEDADRETEKLDTMIEKTSSFIEQLGTLQTSISNGGDFIEEGEKTLGAGNEVWEAGKDLASNPDKIVSGAAYLAMETVLQKLKTGALGWLTEARLSSYLASEIPGVLSMSADEYLKAAGVKNGLEGLDFSKSKLFMDENKKMIDIVVTYDLEISFFKIFFKNPYITIAQRCAVPAWVDGDGTHYEGSE